MPCEMPQDCCLAVFPQAVHFSSHVDALQAFEVALDAQVKPGKVTAVDGLDLVLGAVVFYSQ